MIKKQSSKLDGLRELGRPGIARQLEPESLSGGGESRPTRQHGTSGPSLSVQQSPGTSRVSREIPLQGIEGIAGVAPSPLKVNPLQGPKRGRPRLGETHLTLSYTKPWSVAGMSQATWYRRQREKRDGNRS
jgi:hypothetical protein